MSISKGLTEIAPTENASVSASLVILSPHFPSIVDIQCGEKAILL